MISARGSVVDEWFFLFRENFALRGHFCVQLGECFPFLGQIILEENRLNRAFRDACFAVNALIRVDIEHFLAFVEAFYGADHNAIGVFAAETGLSNYVGHLGDHS